MPTAAKLAAALLFAGLAYYVSGLIKPIFAEEQPLPNLEMINLGFGLVIGWVVAGKRVGGGLRGAFGAGLTTSISLFLVCLFFNSAAEMISRSLRKHYDAPVEAVIAVFELMLEFGERILTPEVIGTSLIGGVLACVVVNFVGRQWR